MVNLVAKTRAEKKKKSCLQLCVASVNSVIVDINVTGRSKMLIGVHARKNALIDLYKSIMSYLTK